MSDPTFLPTTLPTTTVYDCCEDGVNLTTTVTREVETARKWISTVMETKDESVIVGVQLWFHMTNCGGLSTVGFIVDNLVLLFRYCWFDDRQYTPAAVLDFKRFLKDTRFTFVGLEMKQKLKSAESDIRVLMDDTLKVQYEELGELAEEVYQQYLGTPYSLNEVAKLVFGEGTTIDVDEWVIGLWWEQDLDSHQAGRASFELYTIQQMAHNLGAGLYDRTEHSKIPRRKSRMTVPTTHQLKMQYDLNPRKRAQQDVENARQELISSSNLKLWEVVKSGVESNQGIQALCEAAEARDRAWQLELDALLKLQSLDSTAQNTKEEELRRSKGSETRANVLLVCETRGQFSTATSPLVRSDELIVNDSSSDSSSSELEQSRVELDHVRFQAVSLQNTLDTVKSNHEKETRQKSKQLEDAYKLLEQTKSGHAVLESRLKSELENAKLEIGVLQSNLMNQNSELQTLSKLKLGQDQSKQRECELDIEMKFLKAEVVDLKANNVAKENALQNLLQEYGALKSEHEKHSKLIEELQAAEREREKEPPKKRSVLKKILQRGVRLFRPKLKANHPRKQARLEYHGRNVE